MLPSPGRPLARASRDLGELLRRIRAIEAAGGAGGRRGRPVATGWPAAPRLARGVVHEWIGLDGPAASAARGARAPWTPPIALLAHLAWRALATVASPAADRDGNGGRNAPEESARGWVLWIGRALWPYPAALVGDYAVEQRPAAPAPGEPPEAGIELALARHPAHGPAPERGRRLLFERSLFVDPPEAGARLWAVDGAARCPSVAAVVADGSGLAIAATRRLQLAAEAGGALLLLARPPAEARALSAAATRWRVRRAAASASADACLPRWTLELLRAKGLARDRLREGT